MGTVVELLRHAKAYARREWNGAGDRLRPLDERGRSQSAALVADLSELRPPVAAIHSSPLTRCVETVRPLSDALELPIVPDERLAELRTLPVADNGSAWVAAAWLGGRAVGLIDELVARHDGQRVVACSHGDVLPALLALLAGRDGLDLDDVRVKKGGRITLRFEAGRCVEATPVPAAAKRAV